ncbi:uncharacterized protein EDB93DRAFT_1257848 [Suillus bovinus]|uniref:uncharacterized protein n=1 Tax=Suillus bovinus TaxID=48563 RepID=UPI001B8832FE|nr:uncharacterized protein EDB93DRAFT_1257848 [Suillus bovinus]KAG2125999.1 hypothetical protein EDB93DRAFT_1257848 [Suillus bovinus]
MPSEPERQTLLIPLNLGTPAQYDPSIFPVMRLKDTSTLGQVGIVLEATLDEVFKIHKMATDKKKIQDLLAETKASYDTLVLKKEELQRQKKSFNPVKLFSAYRSTRLLVEAVKELYTDTRTTSEKIRRQLLSITSAEVENVQCLQLLAHSAGSLELNIYPDDDLPSDARVSGIAIPLESPLDQSTASFFSEAANFIVSQVNLLSEENPFADDHQVEDCVCAKIRHGSTAGSATGDGVALPGNSHMSVSSSSIFGNNHFIFNNSYVASGSVMNTPTSNHGSSNNQGSCSYPSHLSCVVFL